MSQVKVKLTNGERDPGRCLYILALLTSNSSVVHLLRTKMKIIYAAIIAIIGLCDTVCGVSVVVKNQKVFVEDKPVDLTKLQVIKETDLYKTYELHSGESTITITKSKVGNAISVKSVGPMTEEEKKKMEEAHKKIGEDVEKDIQKVEENISKFNKDLNKKMDDMNRNMQNMFDFPFFV